MEKIKNVLNPGKATDDEIMYGSGRVDDPVHSGNPGRLAGQGSHFNDIRDAKRDADVGNTTALSSTPDVEGSRRPGDTGPGLTSTERSTMPGTFPAQSTNTYSAQPVDSRIGGSDGHVLSKTDAGYDTTPQTNLTGRNTTADNQHHYGRDAAAVGTAGAVAEGIHHHRDNEKTTYNDGSSTATALGPNTTTNAPATSMGPGAGSPHVTSTANRLDPSYNPNAAPIEDARQHTESGGGGRSADEAHGRSHLGRDAAVGAGGIGLAEHEHRKHEQEREAGRAPQVSTTGNLNDHRNIPTDRGDGTLPIPGTQGLHQNEHSRLSKPGDDSVTVPTAGTYATGPNVGHDDKVLSKDYHHGRDAAAVGAAGAYEAEKHHKHDKDLTPAEKEEKRERKHEKKEEKQHHGLSGLLHHDKNKPDTKHEKEIKHQHPDHDRHLGKDAVVGGAAYEAEKKHDHHQTTSTAEPDTMKPLPPAPGNTGLQTRQDHSHPHATGVTGYQESGILPGDGTYGTERSSGVTGYDDATKPAAGHHHGQEAAVGLGGATLAEHEHQKHEKDRALDNKANIKDTNTSKQHHLGRDTAAGVGGVGLAEHEHRKHEKEHGINEPGDSTSTSKSGGLLTKLGLRSNKADSGAYAADDTKVHPSHHGQEATVGAGSVGLAEHEHRKHEKEIPLDESTKTTGNQHHLGRDAALGAGGAGLVEHEHKKHESGHGTREVEDTTGAHKSGGLLSKLGLKSDKSPTETYTTDPDLKSRHHGQEPTAGIGSVGVADHDHQKHDNERALNDNATGTDTQHHLGRDAGVGVGGAGIVEHEHRKHENERLSNVYDDTTRATEPHKSGGLLSKLGLKSDKTPAGNHPDDTTNPSRDHHHVGRDAAVGAGGLGLAEHEHRKHEKERGIDNEKATGPGHEGHHGRDAAVGVGGAGLVEHEHRKHESEQARNDYGDTTGTTGTQKAGGLLSKLGLKSDKSTSGTYADNTTDPNQDRHHLGRDAAVGAGGVGLAEHEHRKHEKERVVHDNERTTDLGHQHHHKQDAAVGAGATGLAEHEHRKHENERAVDHNTPKSGGLLNKLGLKSDKSTTGTYADDTTARNSDHHVGRDAALGAGGVGLAEHEHHKHEREGSYGQDNIETGAGGAHIPGTGPSRNVLHKDPPAGHPAAAGVVKSEANTDQYGRLITGDHEGLGGAGTGTGTSTGAATDPYPTGTGVGTYNDTGMGSGTRGAGTY